MATAIRKHLRDFISVAALMVVAAIVGLYVVNKQRLRVPVLEERPFELKAEMQTAQSVTPGQGQTVRIAGVRVGDLQKVELEEGRAVVTMTIDRKFLPIYRNATVLLRPKTGLKDMFMEMDPGDRSAGEFGEGDMIPITNTLPDINLDEVLEALDTDTQAYLRMLLVGGGEGLKGRGKDLGQVLGSLGPINRNLKRLNTEVATRRRNLARLIHNLNVLFDAVGDKDREIQELVANSNAALGAIASEDPAVQRATDLLGPTLRTARLTLGHLNEFGKQLGPAFNGLRPFARNLVDMNTSLRNLANATTGTIRDDIRPFVRVARKPIRDLRPAARRLAKATPDLTIVGRKINRLGNMVAYNPVTAGTNQKTTPGVPAENTDEGPGPANRDEGYLFWLGWLSHNGNSVFQTQDAHGVYRRLYASVSCQTAATIFFGSLLPNAPPGLAESVAPVFNLFAPDIDPITPGNQPGPLAGTCGEGP
jgi:phospholipid/cholesterol/gamma-HCH transport system substrate-binding protein